MKQVFFSRMLAFVTTGLMVFMGVFVLRVSSVDAARAVDSTNGIFNGSGRSSIGELIVLENLFNGDNDGGDGNLSDVGELIVLERLFSGGTVDNGNGIFDGGTSSIGELIVLSSLFDDNDDTDSDGVGDDSNGLGNLSNVGELIVLDNLFGGSASGRTVVVESGDTLSEIARDFLGDASRWREIADLNNVSNPNLIFPGQRLVLPADGTTGALGGSSSIGELIVLQGLFDGDENGDGLGNLSNIGELIVLDRLFR